MGSDAPATLRLSLRPHFARLALAVAKGGGGGTAGIEPSAESPAPARREAGVFSIAASRRGTRVDREAEAFLAVLLERLGAGGEAGGDESSRKSLAPAADEEASARGHLEGRPAALGTCASVGGRPAGRHLASGECGSVSREAAASCRDACELARRLLVGGRAVLVVHEGVLANQGLAGQRRGLLLAGAVERVVYLPAGCFNEAPTQGAILVLSKGNGRIGFYRAAARGTEGEPEVSFLDEAAAEGLADGIARLDRMRAAVPSALDDDSLPPIGEAAAFHCGTAMPSRAKLRGSAVASGVLSDEGGHGRGDDLVLLVSPTDFADGGLREGGGILVERRAVKGHIKPLVQGDIVIPRSGASAEAFVFEGWGYSSHPIVPLSSVVVGVPRADVHPYYLAALLNSERGLSLARTSGKTKNISVGLLKGVKLPRDWRGRQGEVGESYRRALCEYREARRRLQAVVERAAKG